MNNTQFRTLLGQDAPQQRSSQPTSGEVSAQTFKTPMLGSRARSSIPMTPRSVAGYNPSNDFARQVAEQKRLANGEPPMKKFRSSAAPKGTRLAQGYQDRTSLRRATDEDVTSDQERRLKALEEMMKLQQIDEATFEHLKGQIGVGGDVSSTHLIKGLDWKLLDRIKRGEDINDTAQTGDVEDAEKSGIEDELDSVLDKGVTAIEKLKDRPNEATPSHNRPSGQVLSRDEILERLKAARTAGGAKPTLPPEAALGDRFKKVGSVTTSEKRRFVEVVDGRRREVLLTKAKDGSTKRKVKWLDKEGASESMRSGKDGAQPLGMEVPAEIAARQTALLEQQQQAEEEDDDIFQGVGANYDPLAEIGEESDASSLADETGEGDANHSDRQSTAVTSSDKVRRNYFSTSDVAEEEEARTNPATSDPTILAAIKRAAAIRQTADDGRKDVSSLDEVGGEQDPERALKRKQFMERVKEQDRMDSRDLDLGFGESRFNDDEDEEYAMLEGENGGGKQARKRGPRKRKGDKNNVHDVMSVLGSRKKGGA